MVDKIQMASKLVQYAPYEAENTSEICIREAFKLLESQLRPPFSLIVPSPSQYSQLNQAILYGVLSEPHFFKVHLKHLHAIVVDGYSFFVSLLTGIVSELYPKLVAEAKIQLISVASEMVDVSANGFDGLLISLLRQIVGGDFSDDNLWLCLELVTLFTRKWDILVEEEPSILVNALYTYLRLLSDHCRPLNNPNLVKLTNMEIQFCMKVLQERFHMCLGIGRDLVRLLQDLFHVPIFRDVWKNLLMNPSKFGESTFNDISQIYYSRTPDNYYLLRITPEMETQLRFLLSHVKLGNQKRYQAWFTRKFFCSPDRETVICDIVRFVCCAHHPPNEIIHSDIIPRWAIIGWLLKCCRKNYVESTVKLALFYDWLFFDERVDNVMNIEPAILLMVNSIPKYIDMTHSLLDFLLLLADNYDTERLEIIHRGVLSSFSCIVKKGVVKSLDALTSSEILSPCLKYKLWRFLFCEQPGIFQESLQAHVPSLFVQVPLSSQLTSNRGTTETHGDIISIRATNDEKNFNECVDGTHVGSVISLIRGLAETCGRSIGGGLEILQKIFSVYIGDPPGATDSLMSSESLSRKLDEFEFDGYKLFAPHKFGNENPYYGDEVGSLTALFICFFIFTLHERMQCVLLHCSRSGRPVGARLLSYASRLALEANLFVNMGGEASETGLDDLKLSLLLDDPKLSLLRFHINAHASCSNYGKKDFFRNSSSLGGVKGICHLVEGAFAAYKSFLSQSANCSHTCIKSLFLHDLILCSGWHKKSLKSLFCSIFCYLPDFSAGTKDVLRLLVEQVDHASLLEIQYETSLRKFSVLGEDNSTICHLIKESLTWGCIEQYKLWGLFRSEFTISRVKLESVLLEFVCSDAFDSNMVAVAVEGFVMLCASRPPTIELVGAVILLPNKIFENFASMVLTHWSVSYSSSLLKCLSCFLEKIQNEDGKSPLYSSGLMMNKSTICWLSNYFHVIGLKGNNILSKASENVHHREVKKA